MEIFRNVIIWKTPSTWADDLAAWLLPRLKRGAFKKLAALGEQEICWDDYAWLDEILRPHLKCPLDEIFADLGSALELAVVRTYHGCRVSDAGVFSREGLRINDPTRIQDEARRIVSEESELASMRPHIEKKIAEFDYSERAGRLYVCLDDRPQLDDWGNYALYGSELLVCLLGPAGYGALRSRGVPTMVEIDLPFRLAPHWAREGLAEKLIQEWTRLTVNKPDWSQDIDFTVILEEPLPGAHVVGHYHPESLRCPYTDIRFVSTQTICPECEPRGF